MWEGRKHAAYFQPLFDKISSPVSGWQHNLLNMGRHLILIKYVFNSIPIHILSAINPQKQSIHVIERVFEKFLYEKYALEDKRHWEKMS